MSKTIIPEDVAQFIVEKIDSVAQMEALLLLRNNPEEKWSLEATAERLYISEVQAAEILARLCADGILITGEGERLCYLYQPGSPELRHMLDRVADLYAQHLVPVTNLIHSKPKPRVQEFADAFKLGKDK